MAANRCVNLYLEMNETGEGKEPGGFYSCPGLDLVASIGPGPIRLIHSPATVPTQCVVISGSEVHAIDTGFNDLATFGSGLITTTGPVSAVANSTQYFFTDGLDGYCLDGSTIPPTMSRPLPGFLGINPVTVGYQDGFAFVNQTNTQSQAWYQSNLNDFRVWSGLNFSSADSQPDPIVRVFDLNREVWLMGSQSIEVWINAGLPGFAFQRLQGVFMEVGIAAAFSAARVGQGLMWLAGDSQGYGIVMQSNGYTPVRRSTFAVEDAIRSYSRIDDAFAYCYQDHGHTFYVLTFPTGNATWVYDATPKSGGLWHERAAFSNGSFGRHIGSCYGFFNGNHLIGDMTNGNIYRLNINTATDNGQVRKWLRSWRALPPGKNNGQPMSFDSLSIDMESGIHVPDGVNPQMMLRFSDDGGNSWSNEQKVGMGPTGATAARVKFDRLGSTRAATGLDRVFEISSTDPVQVALIGASMEAGPA